MRKLFAAASCLTLLLGRAAIAQPSNVTELGVERQSRFSIEIEKDEPSASCPDTPWFQQRVASHAGKAGHAGNFKISLSRRGEAWHAVIQRWEQNRALPERVLEDRSTACQPLAEAVAITIAILADDYAQRSEPVAPPKQPEIRPQAPPAMPPAPPLVPDKKGRAKLWIGASGGAAVSWISPVAPVLGFSGAVDTVHTRQALRVMLTTKQKFELTPGHLFVQAWLVSLLSCVGSTQGRLGAVLCGNLDLSMLRASAEGFDQGQPGTRGYGAAGLEAQPSWRVLDRYRISAALAALLPFTRESFSVTGRGVAYIPPPVSWRILLLSEIGAF